ncbi:flagellar basal body P-ring protein FlgI [Aureliella helgolandensis]|uniref:Flagellar basal body P-ring protein n=1 Tax=Aureliella helgolandensis TaxID=2527968 RepID=A0A518GDD1_9BACT|nr:flagellar basal body P-ring protein FlgI [Aureliella helgolandensis]QDV26602.1 flagellar basal body P-ring protein [Aureliella helgolandensis]
MLEKQELPHVGQPATCNRRAALRLLLLGLPLSAGCFSPWFAHKEPVSDSQLQRDRIKESLTNATRPHLVREIGFERDLTGAPLQNVGLVTSLLGTGGKVKASAPREKMLDFMRRNDTENPNTLLDDPNTAMVVASVVAPPAARKGEVLDVIVQSSTHAEASSLERGWLLDTPLLEMKRLGGQVRESFKHASASGQIITVAEITGSTEPADQTRGTIIGGARMLKGRELGIGIEPEFADAITMAAILPAIQTRFTIFNGRKQTGIATPTEDSHISLELPKRYELDAYHFINVVLSVGFNESPEERAARIQTLRRQMIEPTTVRQAAWQLEAIGEEAKEILAETVAHPNPEIRFYSAHALAYLDDRRAIAPLSQLCLEQPAFRAMSLTGLTVIDHFDAEEALRQLLHVADAETRYGAVRALRYRDARDPQVTAQAIEQTGQILDIPSEGPPLVAVSLSRVPEIAFFGAPPQLTLPEFEYVNPRMMIRREPTGGFSVNHFEPGKADRSTKVSADLRSLLIGIAEVGGTYGDWVSIIRKCRDSGYMAEPVAMNPIADAGRSYNRVTSATLEPGEKLYDDTFIYTPPSTEEDRQSSKDKTWYNPFSW